MGLMQFQVPNLNDFDPRLWNSAYVSGLEGIPWAGRISTNGDTFRLERSIDESGKLSIVWPNSEYRLSVLSTSSLRCQSDSYLLPIELARGTLHRVRTRASDWQRLGLKLPEAYQVPIKESVQYFIDALLLQRQDIVKASELAQKSINASMAAMRPLCRAYISQAIQFRVQQERQLSTLLGIKLDCTDQWETDATAVRSAFNTAVITPSWHLVRADSDPVSYTVFDKQIEWAKGEGVRVVAGPLISLQPHAIQNWMSLLHDFDSIYQSACQFVQQTVQRYRGQVQIWNVATGLNSPNDLSLTDEQIMRLAVGLIQTARRADPKTPVIISLDMPWAEYLGQKQNAISPMHFADALIRAELGISGIGLEMNFDTSPSGTLPRDLIDVSDLIDQWSILGIPLVAMLSSPTSFEGDPGAFSRYSSVSQWLIPGFFSEDLGKARPTTAATTALETVQMLLSKQNVHGIFWNQHTDRSKHIYSNAGLISPDGTARPLLDGLQQLRIRHGQ